MPKVLVVAQCQDPVKWEQGFRTHADLFRSMTTKSVAYGISEGNHIAVHSEPSDIANLHESPEFSSDRGGHGFRRRVAGHSQGVRSRPLVRSLAGTRCP